jgi:hypothetical protein
MRRALFVLLHEKKADIYLLCGANEWHLKQNLIAAGNISTDNLYIGG